MIEQNERIAQETGTDLQTAWTKISKNNQRKGMNQNTQKKHQNQTMYRAVFYIVGLLTLALGIILNTKSGLGVSPIISVAFSISTIGGLNFGNTTFGLYIVFVLVELLLHTVSYRKPNTDTGKGGARSLPVVLGLDILQLPLSLIFTRFMNLFSAWIPASDTLPLQLLTLAGGIIFTGIGAAMSLNMRIIPNPGDGIVQAIADCIHRPVGFTKNCFDLLNICITITISMIFAHHLIGIGIGTVVAVLGVGRVIALFNKCFMRRMLALAGM